MEGWIKLHRQIIDHWIFKNPVYFRAWIIMLFTVNYDSKKVLINGNIIECNRGQSVLSIESWVDIFGVSKSKGGWTYQKVRTFFELLETDSMITRENLVKTTRITICNYDKYQDNQQADNNQITTKQQPSNKRITTTKERKESKEEKEYIYNQFYDSEIENSNNDENYINFIKVLFGSNTLSKKLERVLSMQEQVTFEQFKTIYNYKDKYKVVIGDYLVRMENWKDLTKKNTSVQLTLLDWIRRDNK